jgi:hypothetical protein
MSDHVPDRELAALESALKGLAPAGVKFDRDQLFFEAGQASVRSRRWLWPATSAILALTACILGILLILQPEPREVVRVVTVFVPEERKTEGDKGRKGEVEREEKEISPSPSLPLSSSPARPGDYLRLRDQVLRWGVDMLPDPGPLPDTDREAPPTSVLDIFRNKG